MELPEKLDIKQNFPLVGLTTLMVGGTAKYFVEISSEEELLEVVTWAKENKIKVFVLGGGASVIISDSGFDGLVVKMANKEIAKVEEKQESMVLKVAAGESWDNFVDYTVRNSLAGVECLSGVPGTVGASPIQNDEQYVKILKSKFLCNQKGQIEGAGLKIFP
ncbi:MAG: FAD-binding protein [Patescibacteria group bacterium]